MSIEDTMSIDEVMVFCIINVQCPYDTVLRTFAALQRKRLSTRGGLRTSNLKQIEIVLRSAGYRFPATKAKALAEFGSNPIDLYRANREEIIKSVLGVGPKLASLFLRMARGKDVAVMDIHTRRFLYKKLGKTYGSLSYVEEEREFKKLARIQGKSTFDLDMEVWGGNRRK